MQPGLLFLLPDLGAAIWHIGALCSSRILRPSRYFLHSQGSISTTPRPKTHQPVTLDGNQLVIIVGIVCATLLLLPVLILIVKKTQWNKRYMTIPTPSIGRPSVYFAFKWKGKCSHPALIWAWFCLIQSGRECQCPVMLPWLLYLMSL